MTQTTVLRCNYIASERLTPNKQSKGKSQTAHTLYTYIRTEAITMNVYYVFRRRISNLFISCINKFWPTVPVTVCVYIIIIRFHCCAFSNKIKTIYYGVYLQFPPWSLSAANAKVTQTKVVQEWICQEGETERMQWTSELTEQWLLFSVEFEMSTFGLTNVTTDHIDVKWCGRRSCIYATEFWYQRRSIVNAMQSEIQYIYEILISLTVNNFYQSDK